MSKNKKKKKKTDAIILDDFISPKISRKLSKNIDKSFGDICKSYDNITKILKDDKNFIEMDAGTNRHIWLHKKLKNCVFKIAGDSHGITANFREFYNRLIDDHNLTCAYSISDDGVVLVQRKVDVPATPELIKKYKKDVKAMLMDLFDKILLVDCKLTNYKNFGFMKKKNGGLRPVLLDHGDTVPLKGFQDHSLSFDEEMNVSLKCKKFFGKYKPKKISKKDICNGQLKPNKDFSMLVCEKCGCSQSFHDAYKECLGHANKKNKEYSILDGDSISSDMTPEEIAAIAKHRDGLIATACKNVMQTAKTKFIKGDDDMSIKTKRVGKYNVPVGAVVNYPMAKFNYTKLLQGSITPEEYLESIDEDPNAWLAEDVVESTNNNNIKGEIAMNNNNKKSNVVQGIFKDFNADEYIESVVSDDEESVESIEVLEVHSDKNISAVDIKLYDTTTKTSVVLEALYDHPELKVAEVLQSDNDVLLRLIVKDLQGEFDLMDYIDMELYNDVNEEENDDDEEEIENNQDIDEARDAIINNVIRQCASNEVEEVVEAETEDVYISRTNLLKVKKVFKKNNQDMIDLDMVDLLFDGDAELINGLDIDSELASDIYALLSMIPFEDEIPEETQVLLNASETINSDAYYHLLRKQSDNDTITEDDILEARGLFVKSFNKYYTMLDSFIRCGDISEDVFTELADQCDILIEEEELRFLFPYPVELANHYEAPSVDEPTDENIDVFEYMINSHTPEEIVSNLLEHVEFANYFNELVQNNVNKQTHSVGQSVDDNKNSLKQLADNEGMIITTMSELEGIKILVSKEDAPAPTVILFDLVKGIKDTANYTRGVGQSYYMEKPIVKKWTGQ